MKTTMIIALAGLAMVSCQQQQQQQVSEQPVQVIQGIVKLNKKCIAIFIRGD